MKWKCCMPFLLSICLLLASTANMTVAAVGSEQETAGTYLKEHGIMVGDQIGNMNLDKGLTRVELAAILTRLNGNSEHVQAEKEYYSGQCAFSDVPEWGRLYVGYCYSNGLMVGYDTGVFGAEDGVTPAAACTVTLRYVNLVEIKWDYSTACQTALKLGLITSEAAVKSEVTRGDLAVMLYRALEDTGQADEEEPTAPPSTGISKNPDGSINPPANGSQYVPQAGDVIRCDDGTNYTITDVSRWDKNIFASGPMPPLPEAVCDWGSFPEILLPEAEARHYKVDGGDYLFVRNIYECRRMQYTLMNLAGTNPETSKDGELLYGSKGTPYVRIQFGIPEEVEPQVFWPWRESEIERVFNSVPPGTYSLDVWDVYRDGIFQRTEYNISAF